AEKRELAKLAEADADMKIAEAENSVRVLRAKLAANAEAEEAKVDISAQLAEAQAKQALLAERISLAEKEQTAMTVVKAAAERKAKEELAKGNAAHIIEDGNAEVEILRRKLELWKQAGPDAERLFLIQMLPDIMEQVVATVDNLQIDKLTVVDSGHGAGVPAVFNQIAGSTPA